MVEFKSKSSRRTSESFKSYPYGFTTAELLATVAIAGVLATIIFPMVSFATRALPDSTNRLASSFKMARAKAMSQTSAYRLRPTAVNSFIIERANNCNVTNASDWRTDGAFTVSDRQFDEGIEIVAATENGQSRSPASGWSLCFNSRGVANRDLVLTLENTNTTKQKRIAVFPGGAVQVYDDDL